MLIDTGSDSGALTSSAVKNVNATRFKKIRKLSFQKGPRTISGTLYSIPIKIGDATYFELMLISDDPSSDDGDIFPAMDLLINGYSIEMNDRELRIIPPSPNSIQYLRTIF